MAENHIQIPIVFRPATPEDRSAVTQLWATCELTRPWNDPVADFDFALNGPSSTILVGICDATIVASVMVGHDGHRGSVYYMSVHPEGRKQCIGQKLMAEAESWLRARNVPKLNLIVRNENDRVINFYESIGYAVEPNTQLGKRLDDAS